MLYQSRAVRERSHTFPPWAEDSTSFVDAVGVQVLRQRLTVLEDALTLRAVPVYVTTMLVKGFGSAANLPALKTGPVSAMVMFT